MKKIKISIDYEKLNKILDGDNLVIKEVREYLNSFKKICKNCEKKIY